MPSSAGGVPALPAFPPRRSSDLTDAAGAARAVTPVVRLAPAKLNLTLAVVGRRADGYHALHSVMVPLDLADRLSLAVDPSPAASDRSEEHTSELQSLRHLVCRLRPAASLRYPLSLHDALPI